MAIVRWLGQLLLASIFVQGGANAFAQPGGRVGKAAAIGVPQPEMAVQLNGAAMVVGGMLLGLDVTPRFAATLLAACLIPTTVAGHAFWAEEDPTSRRGQVTQFLKNLGLLGGLLVVISSPRPDR